MKRVVSYLIALIGLSGSVLAQSTNDARAEQVLEEVSKKYKAIPSFKASFTYTIESPNAGKEDYNGDVTVKGNKYRLKLGSQEIMNNGTTVWTYMKESNEVNISDYEPDDNDISPNNIFTVYKKGYKYVFSGESKEKGVQYDEVDLMPENRNSQVFKVRLKINKKDRSIRSMKVFEKNGNRSTYTINKFVPNVPVDDKTFSFDKSQYKGVEVIDLRSN